MKDTIASVVAGLCIMSSGDILVRYDSPYRIILSVILFVVGVRMLANTANDWIMFRTNEKSYPEFNQQKITLALFLLL